MYLCSSFLGSREPHGLWDLRYLEQGLNLGPLQWKCRVLTTGLPWNSLNIFLLYRKLLNCFPGWLYHFCIFISKEWVLELLCILTSAYYCQYVFNYRYSNRCVGVYNHGFNFALYSWLVILNIFSCAICHLYISLLKYLFKSNLLPILIELLSCWVLGF